MNRKQNYLNIRSYASYYLLMIEEILFQQYNLRMQSKLRTNSLKNKTKSKHQDSIYSNPFEIIPSEVVFKDIEMNQYYEITVEIRNLTNKAKRIRFSKPQNPNFYILYNMQSEIAPGLSTTAKVKYQCKQLKNQTEIIKVISEDGLSVDLPVRVYKTESQIVFDPLVSLQALKVGRQHEQKILFKNTGKATGTVEISHSHGPTFSIHPSVLKIQPKKQSFLTLKYKPTEAGIFKGSLELKSDSMLVKDHIDVHAVSVEYARYIVDGHANQTTSFDFGTLIVGQQSVLKAFLVNNSPKKMSFRSIFRKGFLMGAEQFVNIQTPSEIGLEQSQKVMFMEPESGTVEPFQQLQLLISCKTKVSYKDIVYTKSYALTPADQQNAINHKKNSNDFKPENIHEYSIMLNSQGQQPIILQLKANAVCPMLKIDQDLFQFGDCPVRDNRVLQLNVQNKNSITKSQISFHKIPNFSVEPSNLILKPLQSSTVRIKFQPKTIGKIDSLQKLYINKIYELDLRCFGIATTELSRSRKRIESIKDSPSFNATKTQVVDFKTRSKAFSVAEKTFISQMKRPTQQAQMMKLQFESNKDNKNRFNKYIIEKRTERVDKQKQQVVQKKWGLYQTKLTDLGSGGKYDEKLDEQGVPVNPPIDYEFETGMNETKIRKQHIALPESKERLFVTKHISDYEPMQLSNANIEKFNRSSSEAPKRIFEEKATNFNHKREISTELKPQQLSQIEVGSNTLNFGEVYIKSKESRYFWIKNGTKKAISVEVKSSDSQLANSYKKPQILLSGAQAAFEICFCKDTLGDYKSTLKYIVNSVHDFELTVTARCVPVEIQIDKTHIKFEFQSSSLEMKTSQTINLYNSGNSNAFFKFITTKDKIFTPKILEGTLKSKEKLSIPILLSPPIPNTKKQEYNYTQRILMKILEGNEVTITCNYQIVDPKYSIKCDVFNSPSTLCLGHQINEIIQVKNAGRTPIVLHLNGKGGLQIDEKLKLNGEQIRKFRVKYQAKEVGKFDVSLVVHPRGGQKKTYQTKINVVQPKIDFSSQHLNMGLLVVQGIAGYSEFTLTSQTQIELPLIIDIRSRRNRSANPQFVELLDLKLLNEDQTFEYLPKTEKSEIDPYEQNQQEIGNLVGQQIDEDQFENSESDEQKVPDRDEDDERKLKLMLKPKKEYKFSVQFTPKQPKDYEIDLPIYIQKSINVENSPTITCEGIKPQFVFEPSCIDFKRKIVTKPDRCYPKFITVVVKNIDDEEITWQVKDQAIKKQNLFNFEVTKGVLKAKQTLEFKVSFNPYTVGGHNHKLPLYISSKKIPEAIKYVDVILKGEACLPMLYFNKRQSIMPVVPLDIETTSSFRVINDGYENCNLKCQFVDDVANIGVKLVFPEGLNIGITKQKIRVDLSWKYSKPISFCLKLQFTDDMNRSFIIPVSGTTDNCIMTSYTYFLRNQGKFQIKSEGPLSLFEAEQPASGTLVRKGSNRSLKSSATNKSILSYMGVSPISPTILNNTIDYILRYLNANLLTVPINSFPSTFIQQDGGPIFEILSFVSSKSVNYSWRYNSNNQKGIKKVIKLYDQYNELIKMLKIEGAHLNHIRPQYLLSFSELNLYLANLPSQKTKSYLPNLLKINAGLYNYLSLESWISLLYQIFKIYVLARVTPKNYKQHLSNPPELPSHVHMTSNFSSSGQNILFGWCEQAVSQVLLEERRISNFDKDYKDGTIIGSLMQKYAGSQALKKMKLVCTTEEDYKDNATIICDYLNEIGMQSHITPKDIYSPLQRQMLLFILHLYVYLPFYTPKQEPILFKCILGEQVTRTIELSNPSSKPVSYMVKYEGSQDFKITNSEPFIIQPKEVYKFQVRFVSRISSPVKGKVMFINVKQKSLTAAALVFELKSEITGRVSDRIWNVSGLMYEQIEFPIQVSNKFTSSQVVDFAISYQTEYVFETKMLKGKNQMPPLPKEMQTQTIYGKVENIKIRKNGNSTLTLNYVPASLYTTKTTIFFVNNLIGQFQHQIIASVQPPAISGEIRPPMTLSVDQIVNWDFSVNPRNEMMARAKKAIESLKKTKKSQQTSKNQTKNNTENTFSEDFIVEIGANPYISAKELIVLSDKPENKVKDPKKNSKGQQILDSENKIPFTIICKNPVYEFSCYVLIFNRSKTDVRRFRAMFTIQPKPLKAILQMNVPARSEVVQNLPIVNNTERDWNIKITWQPDPQKNGNYFQIAPGYSSSFPVKKNTIGNFPITFKPKWAHQAEAKLTMSNPLTLDNFEYQIMGTGQQPLAEDHIEIKCEAKEIIKKQVIVKNPYQQKPINLRVETDLLNCEGPKKLTIPSGGKQKYEFTVQPMLCGQYTGSITFFQEQGPQYIWYTVSITTNYPVAYKTLHMESEIRKKHLETIPIQYSGEKEGSYQVIINGAGLNGLPTLPLKPHAENFYHLQFLPLQVGEQKGSICFINPQIGEILFEFNLKCHPKPPTILNNIKSPLGVSAFVDIELQNPTNQKATVKVVNSNPQQFALKTNIIRLAPLQKKQIQIEYIPASLDTSESASIKFTSKEIGDWNFELSGTGLSPVPFPANSVFNGIKEEHSDSVKFKNPFKYDITVGIKLVCHSIADQKVFRLLNNSRPRFEIESFGVLEIPFSFIPYTCRKYQCQILVMISEKIFWTFPIKGITEINQGKVVASLIAQCRTSTSQFVQISLEGVENFKQNNHYDFSLENVPGNYASLIDKFLIIDSPKNSLNHANDTLQFQFLFKPMKPGKASFDFLVTRKEGSRWRYRVQLEGTEPEPDDMIEIESNLLVTSSISFKMTNHEKVTSQFKAKFTSDSAHQFSVEPKEGILSKFGSKGTNFYVSYTPVEYGKEKKGKLVIQTADMFWSYLLKGSLPKYVPPTKEGATRSRMISEKK